MNPVLKARPFRGFVKPCPDDLSSSPNNVELTQRFILAAFYFATGGNKWTSCSANDELCGVVAGKPFFGKKAWLSKHVCEWAGVECSDPDGGSLVKAITLPENNLTGRLVVIEKELASLKNFRELIINDNNISGTFPKNLGGSGDSVFRINISNNSFTGSIEDSSFPKDKVVSIKLSGNRFTGPIDFFSERLSLRQLELRGNDFSGTVSSSFGDIANLYVFRIEHNPMIVGTMPSSVCSLAVEAALTQLTSSCVDDDMFECTCCTKCY
eukprot:g8704.t1 g8704   contig33:27352-28411(-)